MLQSLLLERVKFIELLFVNGFMMREFLSVEKLKILYNEAVTNNNFFLNALNYNIIIIMVSVPSTKILLYKYLLSHEFMKFYSTVHCVFQSILKHNWHIILKFQFVRIFLFNY